MWKSGAVANGSCAAAEVAEGEANEEAEEDEEDEVSRDFFGMYVCMYARMLARMYVRIQLYKTVCCCTVCMLCAAVREAESLS